MLTGIWQWCFFAMVQTRKSEGTFPLLFVSSVVCLRGINPNSCRQLSPPSMSVRSPNGISHDFPLIKFNKTFQACDWMRNIQGHRSGATSGTYGNRLIPPRNTRKKATPADLTHEQSKCHWGKKQRGILLGPAVRREPRLSAHQSFTPHISTLFTPFTLPTRTVHVNNALTWQWSWPHQSGPYQASPPAGQALVYTRLRVT